MSFHLTRRAILKSAGLGVVTGAGCAGITNIRTRRSEAAYVATDLEVLTVTPNSVTISWSTRSPEFSPGKIPDPIAKDTRIFLGYEDGSLSLVHDDPTPRVMHTVEIRGLEPGRRYRFEAWSGNQKATPSLVTTSKDDRPERTGKFTTLVPPEGKYLGTLVLSNDPHVGEEGQGGMVGSFPPPIRQEEGLRPYAEMMLAGMLNDLQNLGNPFLIVGGDVTDSNTPQQAELTRALLDGYGVQNVNWMAVRGNHDRIRKGEKFESASPVPSAPGYHDPFGDYFVPWRQFQKVELPGGLRLIGLDTTMKDLSGGDIDDDQFDQLRTELRKDQDRPTIVISHHPITDDSAYTNAAGPIFVTKESDRRRIQRLEADHRGVFLHHAGHTHRMKINPPDLSDTNTAYFENMSLVSYPGGYTLLHLYTGGYQVNFQRVSSEDAERWCFRSRWTTFGLLPEYTLGQLHDRNHVRKVDLSGLSPFGFTKEALNTLRP